MRFLSTTPVGALLLLLVGQGLSAKGKRIEVRSNNRIIQHQSTIHDPANSIFLFHSHVHIGLPQGP